MFSVILVWVIVLTNTLAVGAAEPQEKAMYDLEKGGTQVFVIEDEEGEVHKITIEEMKSTARVASGTYKVSCETSSWEAGFYIKIANNKITSAYSPFYTTVRGKIKGDALIHNSNTKASYSFIYQFILSFDTGVVATISGTTLTVSQL